MLSVQDFAAYGFSFHSKDERYEVYRKETNSFHSRITIAGDQLRFEYENRSERRNTIIAALIIKTREELDWLMSRIPLAF